MTVVWLHAQFHLPFRACNALLVIFSIVLQAVGTVIEPPIYRTLPAVFETLNTEPSFQVLPVCPSCQEVYPATTTSVFLCTHCSHPLFQTAPTNAQDRRGHNTRDKPKPFLQFPTKSLEEQLGAMLMVPGMEDKMARALEHMDQHEPGKYRNIFDGKICQNLKAADSSQFFRPSAEAIEAGELRIGVMLGVDWFSYLRSQIAPSHTSCPMSYSVINLPAHLRFSYRTANLFLAGILPGPKEANPDQVQRYLRVLINELLRLWTDGVVIKTPKFPQGHLVRVALVAVVCDKPAAHKLGGFASHSHTNFCTLCWISQADKATPKSFERDGFRPRTNEEQRKLQCEYLECSNKTARDDFVKKNATRWSELFCLPYFNVCEMIVVDPMHNLFLGVVKTHFYHIWVQLNVLRKTKELRSLHGILGNLELPSKLGCLPALIGEPAGGSLTADQWLVFSTIVAPLTVMSFFQIYPANSQSHSPQIPQLWSDYMESTEDPTELAKRRSENITQFLQAKKSSRSSSSAKQKALNETEPDTDDIPDDGALDNSMDDTTFSERSQPPHAKRKKRNVNTSTEDEAADVASGANLHPDDPQHFLKLCSALCLLVSKSITDEELNEADILIRRYCLELLQFYGPSVIRPNHHYATHIAPCVRNYGPLHEFWTFLFERLNKVLKSYRTPNHGGGELETSFFREFHRTVQESRILGQAHRLPIESNIRQAANAMLAASSNDRGTVQNLAQDLDSTHQDGKHCGSIPKATFFDHVIIKGFRYRPSSRVTSVADSLLAIRTSDVGVLQVAELVSILSVNQRELGGVRTYGYVRWYQPIDSNETAKNIWNTL
ncbi:hypothetical protein BT96DRAFT_960642 [Gymnopus androsaceus JB14]|uniref:Uncharacterized protein n=1 Tax=Gymnopus androsaceus JB14 TaxID=1447944 RepID=A0A6A4GK81_9AGAR|nr:hypothetical protein BT96DRAFT_960642 [Gymnopus androsaceus JB14]